MKEAWEINDEELVTLQGSYYDLAKEKRPKESVPSCDVLIFSRERLSPEEEAFINKVMIAINKSETDYAIINDLEALVLTPAQYVIGFDPTNAQATTLYTKMSLSKGSSIWCDRVSDIMTNQDKKRMLWDCLKSNF